VLSRSANVTFTGNHLEDRTDLNVTKVRITGTNTPFIIPQVFEAFPNIKKHEINFARLQDVEVPVSASLEELDVRFNRVERIQRGAFRNVPQLVTLLLVANQIETVDEGAFEGLAELYTLDLSANRIRVLTPQTFNPLAYVGDVKLDFNLLTRIDVGMFAMNNNLQRLYLNYNQLIEVAPTFTRTLANTKLYYLAMELNRCINGEFLIVDEFSYMGLNKVLRTCFYNHEGKEVTDFRRITLEFNGPMELYDKFGNIVASV
jgi:Leucine-rich repeat (LRR) protein